MWTITRTTLGALSALVLAPAALAGGLGDYKDQKHTDRDKVTKETCQDKYIERCESECQADDQACKRQCELDAPEFCQERKKRKRRKTVEVVAKGASVGAGAVAVVAQNAIIARRRAQADPTTATVEGGGEPDPYAIRFFATSALVEAGGGYLTAKAGLGTANFAARWAFFGLSGQSTYMADSEDWILESDFGPTFYIASPNIMFGLQPSLLLSATDIEDSGDGETQDVLLGGGARSYTTVHLRQLMIHFDPMLGVINGQWSYHLRLGVGWRFTPTVYARLNYDYRDIVDLTDLDISSASLQGVVLTLGARWN